MKQTNFRADNITLALLDQLELSSDNVKKSNIIRSAIYNYSIQELGKEKVNELVAKVVSMEKQNIL